MLLDITSLDSSQWLDIYYGAYHLFDELNEEETLFILEQIAPKLAEIDPSLVLNTLSVWNTKLAEAMKKIDNPILETYTKMENFIKHRLNGYIISEERLEKYTETYQHGPVHIKFNPEKQPNVYIVPHTENGWQVPEHDILLIMQYYTEIRPHCSQDGFALDEAWDAFLKCKRQKMYVQWG